MDNLEHLDDGDLVVLANQGDRPAFELLYRRHRQWVLAIAQKLTGSPDDALEVMQEVFIELFNRFPGFVLTSSMRAYLYPAVRHRSVSLIRKRRKVVPLDDEALFDALQVGVAEETRDIQKLVADLDGSDKELLYLRFVLGMKLVEIAEGMRIHLGTVKSRLHNLLKKLKNQYLQK